MEHRGLIKNQLDIGRECKIKMGDTYRISNREEKGRNMFS